MSPLARALSNRKKAASVTAIIMLIILVLTNPSVPPSHRETVSVLEPVTVYASWDWRTSGWTSGWNPESGRVELDLRPMSPFVAPINWKVGLLEGAVVADPNVTGFAQDLVDGVGYYPRAPIPFSEGREFVLKPFLNHTAETITTEVRVSLSAVSRAASYNDTSIQRLGTGYLTVLLDGVVLTRGRVGQVGWGACGSTGPPWCSQVGADVSYDGVKDLTNSTLTFVWNGSAPVHIWPSAEYGFGAKSTDYIDHLQVTESCVVERHLLNYLGMDKPKLSDCEVVSYTPLHITFDVQMPAREASPLLSANFVLISTRNHLWATIRSVSW